jgi:hypothetical protein
MESGGEHHTGRGGQKSSAVESHVRDARPTPSREDVVFRLAAACFATWVVISAATSPVAGLRAWWWIPFLVIGASIAVGMLTGAFMTMNRYLRRP